MSNKYDKHLKSRFKKFVLTDQTTGKIVAQYDTAEQVKEHAKQVADNAKKLRLDKLSKELKVIPQFDPNTGERIN